MSECLTCGLCAEPNCFYPASVINKLCPSVCLHLSFYWSACAILAFVCSHSHPFNQIKFLLSGLMCVYTMLFLFSFISHPLCGFCDSSCNLQSGSEPCKIKASGESSLEFPCYQASFSFFFLSSGNSLLSAFSQIIFQINKSVVWIPKARNLSPPRFIGT